MTEEVAGMDIAGVDKYGGSCRGGHHVGKAICVNLYNKGIQYNTMSAF